MTTELPDYVITEIETCMNMDDAKLLLSYKLYLKSDWHQYSATVIEEMKQELIRRGITI